MKPYIGITGFTSAEQVNEVLKTVPEGTQRKLMVGVLASPETIYGRPGVRPKRFPHVLEIAKIFPDHPMALNLIHFCVGEHEMLLAQMLKLTELAGKNLHGFQLNFAKGSWPDPKILRDYKEICPGKVIVLQASKSVQEDCGDDSHRLWMLASFYRKLADYVLIDSSEGGGKPLVPKRALEYLAYLSFTGNKEVPKEELFLTLEGMMFGAAGGLSPETLHLFEPILEVYPNTSMDVEGKIRDENDELVVSRAKEYSSKAYALCGRYEK